MKKIFLVLLVMLFCTTAAFSAPKAGIGYMYNTDKGDGRFSIEIGDHTTYRFGQEEKKARFALAVDATGGVAFAEYNDEPHLHLDFGFAVLPGVSIKLGEIAYLNICLGAKYARIAYAGDNLKEANGWDMLLSVITLSMAGSDPVRTVGAILDINFEFPIASVGISASYMLNSALNVSAYGALDF